MYLSLVNLPLLASLEKRSTCEELDYFLGIRDKNGLEEDNLANKAIRNRFALFWEAVALLAEEVLSCFQKWDLKASFSAYLTQ